MPDQCVPLFSQYGSSVLSFHTCTPHGTSAKGSLIVLGFVVQKRHQKRSSIVHYTPAPIGVLRPHSNSDNNLDKVCGHAHGLASPSISIPPKRCRPLSSLKYPRTLTYMNTTYVGAKLKHAYFYIPVSLCMYIALCVVPACFCYLKP